MISSKTLRKERRLRALKKAGDIVTIAIGVVVGVGMLWIIQVAVTSI